MKFIRLIAILISISALGEAQESKTNWYSETTSNGITIQNSYPKGGLYHGPTTEYFNYSYLVFYTRIVNDTGRAFEINVNFTADPIAIPNSPHTFVKLFLPADKMTLEKQSQFSYGVTELKSLNASTNYNKTVQSGEDCLFYVVAVFFQTDNNMKHEDRGGNRSEFVLEGQDLVFRMQPQVESLRCGQILLR